MLMGMDRFMLSSKILIITFFENHLLFIIMELLHKISIKIVMSYIRNCTNIKN